MPRTILAAATLALVAWQAVAAVPPALAQGQGRIFGSVLDQDTDEPIAGALVRVEHPEASRTFEATTGEDGRFTVFGLISGTWTVTATADGYQPNSDTAPVMQSVGQPISVWLTRLLSPLEQVLGRETLAGRDVAALEAALAAADSAFNAQRFDDALAGYEALMDDLPMFGRLHVLIGNTLRAQGNNEAALAAYERLLATEPDNNEAKAEVARTRLAMGDLDAAQELAAASIGTGATREDLFNLGEVAFASGDLARASELYEQSLAVDPNWGKPLFKLALVALNQGDIEAAKERLRRVVEVDPDSPEAAQADATLGALP